MNRQKAAVPFQADSTAGPGFSGDGQPAITQGCQVAEQRPAADTELLGERANGRRFATAEKICQLHQPFGSRHLVTNSVTATSYVNGRPAAISRGREDDMTFQLRASWSAV